MPCRCPPSASTCPATAQPGTFDVCRCDRTDLAVLLGNQEIRLEGIDELRVDMIERLSGL